MTDENFLKAKQIKLDLQALDDLRISASASKELKTILKNWVNEERERLKKEFEEL